MKLVTTYCSAAFLMLVFLASCNSSMSLQEYYVKNSENPNFIALDVPASILNLQEAELSDSQREAMESLRKLNVLAFRINDKNQADYEVEKATVNTILDGSQFVELMKLNSQYGRGVIKYIGEEDAIDEVIIFGSSDDKGFAIIRVLGHDMNPAHLIKLVEVIQAADYDAEALGEIGEFLKG